MIKTDSTLTKDNQDLNFPLLMEDNKDNVILVTSNDEYDQRYVGFVVHKGNKDLGTFSTCWQDLKPYKGILTMENN